MSTIEEVKATVAQYSGEEFIDNFQDICQKCANELGILTFGIIIYDETNPEYRKLLRDTDYWDALDKSSGDKMVIFSLPDKVEKEYSNICNFMVPGKSFSNDKGKSYSKLLKNIFNNESLLVYPSILFFQIADDELHDYRLVPLKRKNEFESVQAIQDIFSSISKVLDNVLPECHGNRKEIFNLVKQDLLQQKYTMYILKGPKKVSDFIGMVKNLFFI